MESYLYEASFGVATTGNGFEYFKLSQPEGMWEGANLGKLVEGNCTPLKTIYINPIHIYYGILTNTEYASHTCPYLPISL